MLELKIGLIHGRRFNRYIVECKYGAKESIKNIAGFNRYIVECKFECKSIVSGCLGI